MFCVHCGKQIDSNSKFCCYCGKSQLLYSKSSQEFDFINNDMALKYCYYDVDVHGIQYRNINISTLNINDIVEFEPELENQYDKNAIKIMCKNCFIGYIPKNNLQEMILSYDGGKDKKVKSFISMIDIPNQRIQIAIGFYKKFNDKNLEDFNHIDTTLIKTSKKDFLETPRSENLEMVSEKEEVFLEYQFDSETFIVLSDTGNELGELNKKVSDEIKDINNIHAFILNLDVDDEFKIKCKIRIFI